MSRIANNPLELPKGVELKHEGKLVTVKGPKGELQLRMHDEVQLVEEDGAYTVQSSSNRSAMAGTYRALVGNMVTGVTDGYEKKLTLIGVGYRAQMQGNSLNLNLGFSHPVDYPVPEGIQIEAPSQTEIVVKGADKQKVGQVAAEIRAFRPPEPYKGKGVRYADERVVMKEAKKA